MLRSRQGNYTETAHLKFVFTGEPPLAHVRAKAAPVFQNMDQAGDADNQEQRHSSCSFPFSKTCGFPEKR